MKFPCYSCINFFFGLDRLLGFQVCLVSLKESGQAICYTAGWIFVLVLVTNTAKT